MLSARLMNRFRSLLIASCLMPLGASYSAHALDEIQDQLLSDVTGRDGVAFELEFRVNTNASGNPIGAGCGAATPNYTDGSAEACRMGLSFNNRPNEWLVLKDYYGLTKIGNLWLDSGCTSGTITAGVCTGGTSSAFEDVTRFQGQAGNCLVTGSAGACASGVVNSLPVFVLSFPGSSTVFESDIQASFTVGGVAVEYGASGFTADANGSFMGLKMSDTLQTNARFDIDGKVKVFGF